MKKLLATTSAIALAALPAQAQNAHAKRHAAAPTPLSSDFGATPPGARHLRELTTPTTGNYGSAIGALPWSNGRGLLTGANLQSLFQLDQQILASTLTCTSVVCVPNVSGINAGGDLSGFLSAPTVSKINGQTPSPFATSTDMGAATGILSAPLIGVLGTVGDGTTLNNTALQTAFTTASNGGKVQLGCGVYKITSALAVTIADNKHVEFSGGGPDCTTLLASGPITGVTFNFGGIYSSATVRDMTIATDQSNTTTGVVFSQTASNPTAGLSGVSRIENVNFLGTARANGTYFGKAIDIENVSNVMMNNIQCQGLTTSNGGTCVYLNGDLVHSQIAGVYSINNVQATSSQYGVYINDYIQGVVIDHSNFTSGGYGVAMNGTPNGLMDQIFITNSQFGNNANYDVGLTASSAHLFHVGLVNNYFIEGRTGASGNIGGVFISGKMTNVVGNHWLETVATTQPFLTLAGIDMTVNGNTLIGGSTGADQAIAASGLTINLTGNTITNFFKGIAFGAGGSAIATGNIMSANGTDYKIPASGNFAIDDINPRLTANLWTCSAQDIGSRANVVDANAPTYGAVLTGGGSTAAMALCNGSGGWTDH